MRLQLIFILIALLVSTVSHAKVESEALWSEWYLIRSGENAVALYQEVAEKRPKEKQIAITQNWIEKEDGFSEIYIGSVSADNGKLTPLAFFSERKEKSKTYKLDGRAEKNKMKVTIKPVTPPGPKVVKTLELKRGMYLSSFLPMAIASRSSEKGAFQFTAIVEESSSSLIEIKEGIVEISGESKKIDGSECIRALLQVGGSLSEWWITKFGKVCIVEYSATGVKIQKVSESEGKAALGYK